MCEESILTHERFDARRMCLRSLVSKTAKLVTRDIGEGYRSLALERADSGEPLTYGDRHNTHLA